MPDGQSIAVSGQPDLVLIDQHTLIDYKTTKAVPTGWRSYVCPETDQLIAEGPYALRRKSLDCPHCALGAHLTKSIEAIGPPRAKLHHVLQVSLYRLLLDRNGFVVDRAAILYLDMDTQCRIPIDLLPLDEAERYLRERVALAVQTDLPPILTDEDELWMCDYCPVRQVCEERHGGPVGKAAHRSINSTGGTLNVY